MNENQCVLIENLEQFKYFYPQMRSSKLGMSYDEWIEKYHNMLSFPCYLELVDHIEHGKTLGTIHNPVGTWSNKPLEVLTFEQAVNLKIDKL